MNQTIWIIRYAKDKKIWKTQYFFKLCPD